jgi:hypothetical protein
MRHLGIFILIGFITLSSFGIYGMHAFMGNKEGGCIAALVQDTDCPLQVDSLGYLIFHLEAFKGFSMAVFGENIINALVFTFSLFLLFGLVLLSSSNIKISRYIISKRRYRFRNSFLSHQKQKINKWLAMFENSPTVFA